MGAKPRSIEPSLRSDLVLTTFSYANDGGYVTEKDSGGVALYGRQFLTWLFSSNHS